MLLRKGQQHCATGLQVGRTTPGQHARTGRLTPGSTSEPLGMHMGTYCFWLCRLPRWLREGASGFQDRQGHRTHNGWLTRKNSTILNPQLLRPSETCVSFSHGILREPCPEGWGPLLTHEGWGVILRGHGGAPDSDAVTVRPSVARKGHE